MSDEEDDKPHYPRDKDELLRDLTLVGRLKDIRDQAMLRERLAPKWWEALIVIMQFAAALGLLASLAQYPAIRADLFARMAFYWGAAMIVSLVMGFEFVMFRMHALRRANEILVRQIEELGRHIDEVDKKQKETKPE